MPSPNFTELVQLHERKWGENQYPGRPTLDQLLNGYIVAVWLIGKRFVFSVHSDAQELNDLVYNLMTGRCDDPDHRKLARIFVNHQELDFRIRIESARKPTIQVEQPPIVTEHDKPKTPLRQPPIGPLPQEPNKRYGQSLPGRHVHMLPGRKAAILKKNFAPDRKKSDH